MMAAMEAGIVLNPPVEITQDGFSFMRRRKALMMAGMSANLFLSLTIIAVNG